MVTTDIAFPRGTCPLHAFGPLDDTSAPVVLFHPDAFGPRPASFAVAQEVASAGWRVVMTTPFYEFLPFEPIEPLSIFEAGPSRDRLMGMLGSVTQAAIDADVAALLRWVDERFGSGVPLAALGYCMGGRFALTAACVSEHVRFAGAFHAGRIAPDQPDSVHHRFAAARARIYVGVAGIDPGYGAQEHGRLAGSLRAAGTDHIIETYQGAGHGWVFADLSVYDAAAAAKHHRRIREHFSEMLAA